MSNRNKCSQSNFYRLCGSCCWWATVGWAGLINKGHGGGQHSRDYHTGSGDESSSETHLIKEDTMTKLVYSQVPPERASGVSELLLNSFFRDEPLGIALGLSVKQAERWLPAYIKDAVKAGSSFMAVDTETDKIVGVSVNVIKYTDNTKNLSMGDYVDPVTEPIMAQISKFLGYLGQDVQIPNNPDRVLTILFLNVESHYGGRGIAQDLTRKSEEYALSLGINTFQVDTTSEFSYKVYKKLGYEILREETFAEYDDDGVKILQNADMGPHQKARFLYKIV